ncbi:ATP-grasp domain-containing protein [Erwinia sp. HDF1-3R]|uniref:ATP-grasp domain-containing protein n=1 Tax=Erwinia sp. HDF1-3R TaxID=3141543 RepID=UPI0031F50216
MSKDTVIIVDPFSTGALIAPELKKINIKCYAVLSNPSIPGRIKDSYTGDGFTDGCLYSADEIKNIISPDTVLAVIPGAETGVYCAEALSFAYNVERNDYLTTDWRRKKSDMQKRLYETGLRSISSKLISQSEDRIDDLNSTSGYVIKPDSSCLTDGVVFVKNKKEAIEWISKINWNKKNIMGVKNGFYLVQEKLEGEEFVVDLVVGHKGIKVCALCRYKKGLHNGSLFVYESLDVLDINDQSYASIIEYAKKASCALGVEFGLAHIEIMNTANGPTMIELGARLHGGIAPLLFEECYSPGLLKSSIELLINEFDITPSILIKKARIVFLVNENESFSIPDAHGLENKLNDIHGVNHIKLFIKNNENIPLTTDLSNCPGIVSIVADTDIELDFLEREVRSIFQNNEV